MSNVLRAKCEQLSDLLILIFVLDVNFSRLKDGSNIVVLLTVT
jgi:hypothetical protein